MLHRKIVRYAFADFSEDKCVLYIESGFGAEMLNTILVVVTEVVESQTVRFGVCDLLEFEFKFPCLGSVHNAFKHGILYPDAVVHTLLCDLPEPLFPTGRFRAHVISYQ